MKVTVSLDPLEVTVEDIHPIDYDRAFAGAVDAALRLSRELQPADGD